MLAFDYDGTFEGLLSALFDAYTMKSFPELLLGPGAIAPLQITKRHTVATRNDKHGRVFAALGKKLDREALKELAYLWSANQPGCDFLLFKYLRKIFDSSAAQGDYADATVFEARKLAGRVRAECGHYIGFLRFQKTADGAYFAPIAPRYDVLPFLIPHLADRFGDQVWIVFDLRREYGVIFQDGKCANLELDKESARRLRERGGRLDENWLDAGENLIQDMWRGYFKSACINERRNPNQQRRCLPERFRAYLTEMARES